MTQIPTMSQSQWSQEEVNAHPNHGYIQLWSSSSGQSYGRARKKYMLHRRLVTQKLKLITPTPLNMRRKKLIFWQWHLLRFTVSSKAFRNLEAREKPQYMQKSNNCTTEAVSSRFTFIPMVLIFDDKSWKGNFFSAFLPVVYFTVSMPHPYHAR
jgi:hypothetical protein